MDDDGGGLPVRERLDEERAREIASRLTDCEACGGTGRAPSSHVAAIYPCEQCHGYGVDDLTAAVEAHRHLADALDLIEELRADGDLTTAYMAGVAAGKAEAVPTITDWMPLPDPLFPLRKRNVSSQYAGRSNTLCVLSNCQVGEWPRTKRKDEDMSYCPKCGGPLSGLHCESCGYKVTKRGAVQPKAKRSTKTESYRERMRREREEMRAYEEKQRMDWTVVDSRIWKEGKGWEAPRLAEITLKDGRRFRLKDSLGGLSERAIQGRIEDPQAQDWVIVE